MEANLLQQIRKIKEIKQLNFVCDEKEFIDPYRINPNSSLLAARAKEKIIKYFDAFFEAIKNEDLQMVYLLGKHLHEINATKLGYSAPGVEPRGKGFSQYDLVAIYNAAQRIKDHIVSMPDILVFAEKVGPDKISDLTTNIIYEELLQFTKEIIDKYNLPIEYVTTKKWIIDVNDSIWIQKELMVPVVDGKEILFLPEEIVTANQIFSYLNVYNDLVWPFYKSNPAVHNLIRTFKKVVSSDCKKLKKRYPPTRATVEEFRLKYPDKYDLYKENMQKSYWRH